MRDLLSIGTNRRESMIGTGIGLGLAGYRLKSGPSTIPESVPGLQLWLDAADPMTLFQSSGGSLAAADGDPVGEWRDKTSNNNHMVQVSGTSKPALKTAIKNGKNVIRLDGVNDYMAVASSTAAFKFLHSADNSVFIVFNCSSFAATRTVMDNTGLTSNAIGHAVYLLTTGASSSYAARNVTGQFTYLNNSSSSFYTAGSWFVYSSIAKPTDSTAANRSTIYKNGGSSFSNNAATNAASTANASLNLTLGADASSFSSRFVGDFAEILIYNSALSSANRQLVENYLNEKWGVY